MCVTAGSHFGVVLASASSVVPQKTKALSNRDHMETVLCSAPLGLQFWHVSHIFRVKKPKGKCTRHLMLAPAEVHKIM